jgi:hypothetical protein
MKLILGTETRIYKSHYSKKLLSYHACMSLFEIQVKYEAYPIFFI